MMMGTLGVALDAERLHIPKDAGIINLPICP